MDHEYETMSPPGSPGGRSAGSSQLSARQYCCVNISKFVIELIGTALFTIFFYMMNGRYSGMLLSLWVVTLFGINISGAHFNPCITVAQMFRAKTPFRRRKLLGVIYLLGQFCGGILGATAIATLLKQNRDTRINVMPSAWGCEYKNFTAETVVIEGDGSLKQISCAYGYYDYVQNLEMPNPDRQWKGFQSIISEMFGTFTYVLFFLICTDPKLQYSQDQVKNSLIIASSYVASQLMAGGQYVTMRTGPCFNPATAFGLAFFQMNFHFLQYIFMPWAGMLIAVLFYEFVFVRTQEYLVDDASEMEEDQLEEEEDGGAGGNVKGDYSGDANDGQAEDSGIAHANSLNNNQPRDQEVLSDE